MWDLGIGKDINLSIDVLTPPLQCHECIRFLVLFINMGQPFAKYYLSEYFRTFYKGKIILVAFPRSPGTDKVLIKHHLKQITFWKDNFTVKLKSEHKIDIEGYFL